MRTKLCNGANANVKQMWTHVSGIVTERSIRLEERTAGSLTQYGQAAAIELRKSIAHLKEIGKSFIARSSCSRWNISERPLYAVASTFERRKVDDHGTEAGALTLPAPIGLLERPPQNKPPKLRQRMPYLA